MARPNTLSLIKSFKKQITDSKEFKRSEISKHVQNIKYFYKPYLREYEKEHIINVVSSVKGNKTKAAEILGIDRKTLREKLKKYS